MAIQNNTSSRSAQISAAAALLNKNDRKRSSPRLAGTGTSGVKRGPEWFKVPTSNDNSNPAKKGGAAHAAGQSRSVRTKLQDKLELGKNDLGIQNTEDRKGGGPKTKKIATTKVAPKPHERSVSPTSNSSDGADGVDDFDGAGRQFQEGSNSELSDGALLSASSSETECEHEASRYKDNPKEHKRGTRKPEINKTRKDKVATKRSNLETALVLREVPAVKEGREVVKEELCGGALREKAVIARAITAGVHRCVSDLVQEGVVDLKIRWNQHPPSSRERILKVVATNAAHYGVSVPLWESKMEKYQLTL